MSLADNYADEMMKKMKNLNPNDLAGFKSIEQLTMDKRHELTVESIQKYPKFVRELGDLLFQAKYSPNTLKGWKKPKSYFNFNWYILAEEIVLSHSFFEAFLSTTIEIICKSSLDTMRSYLGLDPSINLKNREIFEQQLRKVNRKIGGKSFEKRIDFLNGFCNLKIPIDENRKKALFVFEQLRHLIVHRNGIVDREYIKKMKKLNFQNEEREKG